MEEYAKVDKSKKRTSQEKPAAEYDDTEVENKMTKVSVHNCECGIPSKYRIAGYFSEVKIFLNGGPLALAEVLPI